MGYKIPEHLNYTKEHEWIESDGDTITVGITDFAQSQLGDIVFVDIPETGASFEAGSSFGVVESIKSVSDLYMPVSGEILEVNEKLVDNPENLNTDPYGSWMIKVRVSDPTAIKTLLSASDYKQEIK